MHTAILILCGVIRKMISRCYIDYIDIDMIEMDPWLLMDFEEQAKINEFPDLRLIGMQQETPVILYQRFGGKLEITDSEVRLETDVSDDECDQCEWVMYHIDLSDPTIDPVEWIVDKLKPKQHHS